MKFQSIKSSEDQQNREQIRRGVKRTLDLFEKEDKVLICNVTERSTGSGNDGVVYDAKKDSRPSERVRTVHRNL